MTSDFQGGVETVRRIQVVPTILDIANEIAIAHAGVLDVRSTEEETRFTFRMPRVVD